MALFLFCFVVDGVQGHVKEDGFLTPAEEAEWSSTIKLGENEAQPRLKRSSFLCFDTEPQRQVHSVSLRTIAKYYGCNSMALHFIYLYILVKLLHDDVCEECKRNKMELNWV